MKLKEILTEGIWRQMYDMAEEWNLELGGQHPKKGVTGPATNFFDVTSSNSWWTRGDGGRYKAPSKIRAVEWSDEELAEKITNPNLGIRTTVDVMNWAWNKLTSNPKARPIEVSGEHGSDEYKPAVVIGPYVFIRYGPMGQNPGVIYYASKSILRNKDIWRSR